MSGYEALLFLHIASVILWLGAGTTLALIALYGQRSGDQALLQRLGALGQWLGLRAFAPGALGAFVFGAALVVDGGWSFGQLWISLGLAAFATSFLLNAAVRFPLIRRLQSGAVDPRRAGAMMTRLSLLDLAVLYLTVADMAAKPTGADTITLAVGGAVLVLAALPFLFAALRAPSAQQQRAR